MDVRTRVAADLDLPFLCDADRHLSTDAQSEVVARGCVLVAEVGGDLVGLLRWGLFWDQVPFMNLLWVVPERRGLGIGTALVHAWEASQRAAGHELVLTSTVSAERSQQLYRRLGYVDSGVLLLPDEPAELILRHALG